MTVPPVPGLADARRRPPATRPSPAARRFGYLVAIGVQVVLILLITGDPGWRALPFLTEETTEVLPWVLAQLVASIAVNAVWLIADPPWLRALGEVLTSVMGLAAAVQVLAVFPFAFDAGSTWPTLVRVVLWVGVVGSALGVLVNLGRFVRTLLAGPPAPGAPA